MDNPRCIVGVQWLEAGASDGNSVLILRVHYSNRGRDGDVLTVYHYPEVGMYVIVGDFAEAGKGEVIARLLVLVEGDAPYYDGHKDSQQDDEPWYPSPPILLWPAHPLVSPPPRSPNKGIQRVKPRECFNFNASETLGMVWYEFEALLERPQGVGTWTYLALTLDQEKVVGTN